MENHLSLEDRVEMAKNNRDELNRLIEDYKPFIATIAQHRAGRFLNYGFDDELSIGMMAFQEAVDHYDGLKGKFLTFAKHVIDLRLIDFYRKNRKIQEELQCSSHSQDGCDNGFMDRSQGIQDDYLTENQLRRIELLEYRDELSTWNIPLNSLVKSSPKQNSLRELYKRIAGYILENKELLSILLRTQRLPLKQIEEHFKVQRKKLERGRIYIIALVLAMRGNYEYIQEYIDWR